MKERRLRTALPAALAAALACSTVHLPQAAPVTEASLGEAIETLNDSGGRVELVEGGIVADLYVYEWRRVERSDWRDPRDLRRGGALGIEADSERRLVGPKRGVYLPYRSILAVRARSWPLWSGVELELDEAFRLRGPRVREAPSGRAWDDAPVVIKARDEQDARKLSEAIDRVRRARLPAAEPAEAPEAAPVAPESRRRVVRRAAQS